MRTVLAGLVLLGVLAAPAAAHDVDVDVVSSRADQVSGGDALIRIEARRRHDLRVFRNGAEVTDAFELRDGALVGLVDGLRLGRNRITVYDRWRRVAKQHLENHPIEGPIFSGPHQRPFVCKTNQANVGLGEPLVDNQEGDGFRVLAPDGSTAGWSRNCSVATRVDWLYRRDVGPQVLVPLPPGPLPADVATTTTLDGKTVPFVVRRERGTINRFIYSLAMLADPTAPETDTSRWNRRLVYFFDGGVAIGRNQGTPGGSALNAGPARPRLRDRALERDACERPLQHGPRRRDRADDQGALRRALRRAAVHGRHRRLRRRDPAVPVRPEPPRPARRRDPDALVPRHGHPDHPHRRLRAARALHGRHRRVEPEVADVGQPRVADRPQRERHEAEPVHRQAGQH